MNRSQYDTDVATWNPQGRLLQVEYAMESVNQGSCSLGICGQDFAVLAAMKRSSNALASYQSKVFKIDDHIGIAIAGLTADARTLATYMRTECLNHKFQYNSPIITGRLVGQVADKHQAKTMASWKRPYGVGLLVIGCDRDGPHLYQTCPSGNLYEQNAMAIGARSNSAKTYLEKHLKDFEKANKDKLIIHALNALKGSGSGKDDDKGITVDNVSVAVVGRGQNLEFLEGDALAKYISKAK